MKNFRVLVVEDNFIVRDLFRYAIETTAFRYDLDHVDIIMFEADNGKAGWSLLHQQTIDLVIVDLYMPVMDGGQLIEYIRADERLKTTPIVVVSCGGVEGRTRALQTGADVYLDKPIKLKEISKTIESFILTDRNLRKQT